MSLRPVALENRIARNLIKMIETHAQTYPHLWAVVPKTVLRFRGDAMATLPRPAIYLSGGKSDPIEGRPAGGTDGIQWERANFTLTLLTEDQDDPQGAIVDLIADVRRVLMGNRNMAGVDDGDGQTLVVSIKIGPHDKEAINDDPADGVCDQTVFVDYKWTKDEP